jgi:hypothetical protein
MFAAQPTFFARRKFPDDKAEFDTRWLLIALTQAMQLRQCLARACWAAAGMVSASDTAVPIIITRPIGSPHLASTNRVVNHSELVLFRGRIGPRIATIAAE